MSPTGHRPPGQRVCVCTTSHDATDARVFGREASTLAAAGYNVTLYTPFGRSRTEDGVAIRSFEGIETGDGQPPLPGVATRLRWAWDLFVELYDTDYDVYHVHDSELLPVGVALAVLTNSRVVYDVHENVESVLRHKELLPGSVRPVLAGAISVVETTLAGRIDGVVAASEGIARRFAGHENAITVTNYPRVQWTRRAQEVGALPDHDSPDPESEAGPVQFVYCGLLSEDRGIPTVIEAVSDVPEAHDIRLVLGGKYENEEDRRVIEHDAAETDRVELVGWQDTLADVFDLLYESDVGVMCFEPDPNKTNAAHRSNKLFWYMAAALPIIVSDIGNWTDVVEGNDCGIAVDPLDPEAIADAMTELVENPERRAELGLHGYEAALSTYNWEVQRDRLLDLYDRLIGPLPTKIES